MGNWRWLVVGLCLPTISCTVLFSSDESTGGGNDPIQCEGAQRCYERGAPVEGDDTRFEYLDYAQGTITFWAKAGGPVAVDTELVNLGGIRIVANADGTISASLPTQGGEASYTTDANNDIDWENDGDVFIALRWDSKRPVSGDEGGNFHLMLRVDLEGDGGVAAAFDVAPGKVQGMSVGDAEGVIQVDQLVVYGRPLYVDDGRVPDDELGAMSFNKTDSAQLLRGGVGVSFATSAPIYSDCQSCAPLAWSMPLESEVGGYIRSGGSGISWNENPMPVPDTELIFSNGVAVGELPGSTFDIELASGQTYSLYALAHGEGQSSARLRVSVLDSPGVVGEQLLDLYANAAGVERPSELFATFQMPGNLRYARIELSRVGGGSSDLGIFHSLAIRENFYRNASFEIAGEDAAVFESWSVRADTGVGIQGALNMDHAVHTGGYSACFQGTGTRSDVHQLFGNSLIDEEFYAAGAMFTRGNHATDPVTPGAITPGVSTGNSTFFGTGAPHEEGKRVKAASPSQGPGDWAPAGVVSYRLYSESASATNDQIYFGGLGGQPADVLDHCVDDAYFYPVKKLIGISGDN